jgi:beta-lactamase class A
LGRAAQGHVSATEGFDRLSSAARARGERAAVAGGKAAEKAAARCPRATPFRLVTTPTSEPREPRSGEAFFGTVRTRIPAGTRTVEVRWNGSVLDVLRVRGPSVSVRPSFAGRTHGTLDLRFLAANGKPLEEQTAKNVWALPATGSRHTTARSTDARLDRTFAAIAAGFDGYSAIASVDLASGRSASWNADSRFPAASLTKLGVLAASLRRFGPEPDSSAVAYDMRAIASWSSNLAANRLLGLLGRGSDDRGRAVVESQLKAMGATQSTYPGEYRVGTARSRGGASPDQPPLVSQRTTTANDMTAVLSAFHAAAIGAPGAQGRTGLSRHAGRLALSYLLDSEPGGDNLGLLRPSLPKDVPLAQKHGWLNDARHSVAIIFAPSGPVVLSVLTYREGLTLARAQNLGRLVVRAVMRR